MKEYEWYSEMKSCEFASISVDVLLYRYVDLP